MWIMRQAGRYLPEYREIRAQCGGFLDLCYTPELAAEVTLQPIRRFGLDAAIIFSDILVVPHALGQEVRFVEGEGPRLDPITSRDQLKSLSGKLDKALVGKVGEALGRVKAQLPPHVALIGFCGAPWTVATYMVAGRGTADQAPARQWAYSDRQGFGELIRRLTDASIDYLLAQIDAGAEVVQIFDTWAGILPRAEFERWSLEPIRQIAEAVARHAPQVPVIAFPRGAAEKYPLFCEIDAISGLGIDWSMSPRYARDRIQASKTVQGNLDPLALVAGGMALEEAVEEILAVLSKGPFIFNLGHGIVPHTPIAHVEKLVAMVRGEVGD